MKNTYLFNPLIITSDFGNSLIKSIRSVYPHIKWVPCLFHFAQCQVKYLKKLNLFTKKNKYIGIEILFNIEQLCFIDIKKLYKLNILPILKKIGIQKIKMLHGIIITYIIPLK